MNQYLPFLFTAFASVFLYQTVVFAISDYQDKSSSLRWLTFFAASSSLYTLSFIPMYLTEVEFIAVIAEWSLLLSFVTYTGYMICLNNYLCRPSTLKDALIVTNILVIVVYVGIIFVGYVDGVLTPLQTRVYLPLTNVFVPMEFIEKYEFTWLLNVSVQITRFSLVLFLCIALV